MARDNSDGPDPLFRFVGVVEMDGRPIPVVNEHVSITHSPKSLKKIPFLLFDPRTNERVDLAQSIGDDGEDEEVEMLLFILAVFMKAAAFLRTNERLGGDIVHVRTLRRSVPLWWCKHPSAETHYVRW